jgi:Protein of unknown function (DUF4019)
MKPALLLAGLLCLLFASMPKALASAEDQIDNALLVSKAWMAQIDAGQYDDSYAFGCDAMHDKVPQDRWGQVLKALRTPWGPVVDRKPLSHIYKPNGYEGSEGEFMVITYDSSFKKLGSATEIVVLKWEGGKWRGAGYNAQAKLPSDDDTAPPPASSTTETHTDSHVKPEPQ